MGIVDSRRPPLPQATESMDDDTSGGDTEVATNVTTRTDKTHYTVPEDGRPITISTQKINASKESPIGKHARAKSQTSLLIEYFEASKTGDKSKSRPSVRVKVTPSASKMSRSGENAVQITSIGTDRKPSYTRRISLPSSRDAELGLPPTGTEVSHSSDSNVSGRPPVEIEVLNSSDVSDNKRSSRGLMYAPVESNVSSMPPDSMLEGDRSMLESERAYEYDDESPVKKKDYLREPQRTGSQSRSASRERLTQKVMEKLGATSTKQRKSSREHDGQSRERRRRSSKSHRAEADAVSGAESSLLSSNLSPSERSYRSDRSQTSRMTNNPKLLEMVEDTIKRMILPEINALKEDQHKDRNLRSFEQSRRSSGGENGSLERRVSKSSSTPHMSSKPKVVLNRDGDDPGVVLSRGDSERVKHRKSSREYSDRPSSRRSSGRHSREGSYEAEEKARPTSSRSNNGLRGAAAAGLAAGALTAAALRHHDSQDDVHLRRKKRTKSRTSRSRSASITDTIDQTYTEKKEIPPLPLASRINDSEITRESILSQGTDRPSSRGSADVRTPIREVKRGSVGAAMSPASSRTPTRPSSRGLGMSLSNQSIDQTTTSSVQSPNGGITNRERLAALTAAGLGGAAAAKAVDRHMDADGYGDPAPQRKFSGGHSPVQSVSSLKNKFEDDPLVPHGLRPRSAASYSSAGRLQEHGHSQSSLRSGDSPTTQLARSAKQSRDVSVDEYATPDEKLETSFTRETGTPGAETADEWLERQHLINEQYRDSMATNRDSYQTNPYPQDEKRFTMTTDDSYLDRHSDDGQADVEQEVRDVTGGGLAPNYVHTPVAVESAVASLMEPSTVSSHVVSSTGSPSKSKTYSARMEEQLRSRDKDAPPLYQGSTLSQNVPSQDRWAAIKGHARTLSSPSQSPARDLRNQRSDEKPVMTASGLPNVDDPLPEIGHFDDSKSDLTTNPSIIQGPLGGDATGNSTWPYTPEPEAAQSRSASAKSAFSKGGLVGAAAGGAAALAAAHKAKQPTVEDGDRYTPDIGRNGEIDREATPTGSPAAFRDEGYVTDGRTRSGGGATPKAENQVYGKKDLEDYQRAMDAQDGDDDPFTVDTKHTRHFSGNSQGLNSPLYDASTGKGLDRIQSQDVVALMDHLTVRDAQRNARDTEILVTLVRSAAEMRQSFDEMKKFIMEQDKMIMQNTDRDAEYTAQKVLGGPRPQPVSSPRTPRRAAESEEDVQRKRKGVLRRALKGLTGGKSAKDLARIEDMLMQVLDNVEDLKHQQGGPQLNRSYTQDSLDTYEQMRATQDSGYEPEGQADTSSTPSQSGHFPVTPREKQQYHSGYDGRRGSDNRVSTVVEEEDDEDLEPHETHVLNHQFENNERLLTPTQELHRRLSPRNTPPQKAAPLNTNNDATPEKQKKHKSNSSSLFGVHVPKISRWSRTTTSSAAPDPATIDSPRQDRTLRPSSEASRSQSALGQYDEDGYSIRSGDRRYSEQDDNGLAQAETRSMRSQASKMTRTPSPLIPSQASAKHRDQYDDDDRALSPEQEDDEADFEDPKYQAHRNSLLLQHPQPRQGHTSRHQNTLESQAHTFDDTTGTNSDLSQRTVSDFDPAIWGSSGTAGLARHRLTQAVEPISPISMNSHDRYGGARRGSDDAPLIPQKPAVPPKVELDTEDDWDEPEFSNSGFSKGGYYSSPYGSGHLLEPIAEVRYSLETDSGHISPEPHASPQVAKAVDVRSPGRKITPAGPRSMPGQQARLVDNGAASGTVRRKPVPSQGSRDSFESETF
ncbi:hypothetical protein AC578_1037 [Pseudocercospora eumusae]|uniref:Transaldolase n=1 Tax=Pseudocercospora eumusae TaxID=321146 RepID=A0A139HTP8_9PEZI|nr:hypothetical protein AC578_1037 [Pseudocercospora eumusae]